MPQQFADPTIIAAEQEAERQRQLAREHERQERERREYERVAAARLAWAERRDQLVEALAEARRVASSAEGELTAARASGDIPSALEAAVRLLGAQELASLAEADLQGHQRVQP
ncbi:MAG: hypothetical protein M0027_05885 [Candidatus Dormibacteraeota bacterium]|jgi:hypothetical protein|nr:hypothetical protein [Candidatus Dormibacteraeota bacterium]